MDNIRFLKVLQKSFVRFLETGSHSNEKLKILHGSIAEDLAARLGADYTVQSLGYGTGKEGRIKGRYIDKNVDIAVTNRQNKAVAGIAVKFVMQNYAQNANNYFENMLGETANIQSSNTPYFQIFIIPAKLPYYKNNGGFDKWETFHAHHLDKYRKLSYDNNPAWVHPPAKTLLYVLALPETDTPADKNAYVRQYLDLVQNDSLTLHTAPVAADFGSGLICNDYETFIAKAVYRILSE
ncbi:Uncharacterised protein [Kingella potus]|uniref:Uncharacterized protein n=1 Tax=Kingella potus TaxID=265175 RepID=A0A377QYL8_9NEIS|nr:hypothetical protein [Kingella potus]UOP01793.1 hypothetical protein LVJ84_06755 [Kingella potus]STQ99895.1 Uncharacterised protein [Kingella potus]